MPPTTEPLHGDWLDLAAPWFQETCRRSVDDFLADRGFRFAADDDLYVTYRRGKCEIVFHYWLEDMPDYAPMVSIGLVRRAWSRPALSRIGLWYAIPEGEPSRDYETWRFSSAAELAATLGRIKDEVLETWGAPLWEDPDRLARLIRDREKEWRAEHASSSDGRKPKPRLPG